MERSALELVHRDDGLILAMYGPLCIALWSVKPTVRSFEIQRAHLARVVAREPGKIAFLCVVSREAEPPDDAIRSASAEMVSSHGANLKAVACVIEGSGFRAAITRTVLSGIMLLARTRAPIHLFESVEHAAPWLGERLGRALTTLPSELASLRDRSAA